MHVAARSGRLRRLAELADVGAGDEACRRRRSARAPSTAGLAAARLHGVEQVRATPGGQRVDRRVVDRQDGDVAAGAAMRLSVDSAHGGSFEGQWTAGIL